MIRRFYILSIVLLYIISTSTNDIAARGPEFSQLFFYGLYRRKKYKIRNARRYTSYTENTFIFFFFSVFLTQLND